MSALAEPPQWPPPEVTTQPHPDPAAAPPIPPAVSTGAPAVDADTTGADFLGWVTVLLKLATAFGAGVGSGGLGYHLTCRRDQLSLSRGPMDLDALKAQLDRIEQRLEWIPAEIPPSRSPPRPADLPAPLPLPAAQPTIVTPL
jgi:hypothetical protein